MERRLNYAAIIVAGIAYWCIQAGWYTLLGEQWLAAMGKTRNDMHGSPVIPFIGSLVCDIIVAWALAWVLTRTGRTTALAGAVSGAALSIGFFATGLLTQYLFEEAPRMLFYINAGCALVGMTVAGAIVGAWKKSGAGDTRGATA
ncbi:MAG: DUF1761 domain-containing protein [Terriglobales bacterium]